MISPLRHIVFLILFGVGRSVFAQELAYFETTYHVKLEGIAPLVARKDPQAYYNDVASRLGIIDLAIQTVKQRYGWGAGDGAVIAALPQRSGQGWEVGVFVLNYVKEPKADYSTSKVVRIDDSRAVLSCEDYKKTTEANQVLVPTAHL
jgi:hypothetical protein